MDLHFRNRAQVFQYPPTVNTATCTSYTDDDAQIDPWETEEAKLDCSTNSMPVDIFVLNSEQARMITLALLIDAPV